MSSEVYRYTYYHGSILNYANGIVKNGFETSIGSLGHGAYAFSFDKQDAACFAWHKFRTLQRYNQYIDTKEYSPCIISFKLRHFAEILDFTDPCIIKYFNAFTNTSGPDVRQLIGRISNLRKVKRLDGTIVDIFIKFLAKSGLNYQGVYNPSQNKISNNTIPDSRLPNSIELCIKESYIIDSIHLIRL